MNPGVIILSATLLVFVGIAIVMIVWSRKYKWPDGYVRTTAKVKGHKVTLLTPKTYSPDIKRKDLARRCALVVVAAKQTWEWPAKAKVDEDDLRSVLDWTVCWFKTDEDFQAVVDTWIGKTYPIGSPAAHTATIPKKAFGGGLPASVARMRYISEVYEQGSPFIHELTHHLMHELLGTWGYEHIDKAMWQDFRARFDIRYAELIRGA